MDWIYVTDPADLKQKGKMIFKHEGKQLAVFAVGEAFFAIDNRCPHEGYPLREGSVSAQACVLTCQWHNWKFDLKTGKCLQGEDHVRTYPTRCVADRLEVDLSDPTAEAQTEAIMEGLREAVAESQYGRIVREVARLETAKLDTFHPLRETFKTVFDRLEYGTSHAFAATADWLLRYSQDDATTEDKVLAVAESLHHLAEDTLRQKAFPYTEAHLPFNGPAFLAAIEAEEEDQAIAHIRGALAAGLSWAELLPWFSKAALAHYIGFGHALIYVRKTGELLQFLGSELMESLCLPLTRYLVRATREDLIPDFKAYAAHLADRPAKPGGSLQVTDAPFGKSVRAALAWTNQHYENCRPEAVFDALLGSLAKNMLYFDMDFQFANHRAVQHNVNWLDFTHGLTFANAVRQICTLFPELWYEGLLQMACFVGRNSPYVRADQDVGAFVVVDRPAFLEKAYAQVSDHGLSHPIFSCHLLKTTTAVAEEWATAGGETQTLLLASLHRFLSSPIKEKYVRRTVRQALALVDRA